MRRDTTDETPEERIDERDDETSVIPSAAGSFGAWTPGFGYTEPETDDPALADERTARESSGAADDEGGWWDEGLITLLLVVGVVLFVIPEPATSGLGILLISVGALAWLVDLATADT